MNSFTSPEPPISPQRISLPPNFASKYFLKYFIEPISFIFFIMISKEFLSIIFFDIL